MGLMMSCMHVGNLNQHGSSVLYLALPYSLSFLHMHIPLTNLLITPSGQEDTTKFSSWLCKIIVMVNKC